MNSPIKRRPGARPPAAIRSVNYSISPLLASRTPPWRSKFLVALFGIGSAVLVGRALYVQVIGSEFFVRQGEVRYARTLELPANRGRITDRNGILLAASVPSPSLWAIPKEFNADAKARAQLARLLGMTSRQLDEKLAESPNFVWLRRQADDNLARQVLEMNLAAACTRCANTSASTRRARRRRTCVGFTNVEDRGQEGIEFAFQRELAGSAGSQRVIKDRFGRVVEDLGESAAATDGKDVELSIDSKIQFFAYQRVRDAVMQNKAKAGSVVVLDTHTGEVLALANYPSYVPDDRRKLSGDQLRNRAMTDTFEPGSTMKPFIAALAMESGRVRPETVIQTAPGRMTIGRSTISDSHPQGALTVQQVIQKSSNVGTVKMAMQMQPREMHELFTQVGFGQKPQLDFPGAVTGRLRPYKSWKPIEQATMAYGYGLSASLFQLARAYTVFAHDGELLPISLVRRGEPGQAAKPTAGVRVISPKTAAEIRTMLQMVTGPGGTAPKAQALGYSVGGKTGTAYKQEGSGYSTKKYRAWFVGMAPIVNPRIVVAVMVDEPSAGKYYGGEVAAPVFSEVVQQTLRTLGVAPDTAVAPQIVAHQLPAVAESF